MSDVTNDFLAAHGRAQQGDDSWIRALASGGSSSSAAAGAPAASPAAASSTGTSVNSPSAIAAAPGTEDDNLPLGTRLLNAVKAAPAGAVKQYTGDIAASWDQLKTDYLKSRPDFEEYKKHGFWDNAKAQFGEQLSAGKTIVDAFNLAISPITAAVGTVTKGIDAGVHAIAPATTPGMLKEALDQSMIAIGPEGGPLAAAAKVRTAAEIAGRPEGFRTSPGAIATEHADDVAALESQAVKAAAPKRDYMFADQKPDAGGRLRVTDADRAMATDYLAGKTPDNPVQASLDTLSDQGSAREAIKNIARFIPEGAVKPDDVTMMGAYALQRTPEQILAGLKSVLPTDEEIVAWKMTMDSTGREVKTAADTYAADPTLENFDAAARAFTLALKITKQWDEVGTEQGRALRARQTATAGGDDAFFGKGIREILANVGPDNVEEAIRKAAALEDPAKVPAWLSLLRRMKSRDGLVFGWYNILLSNVPKTVSKKLFGDGFAAAWQLATHGMAEAGGAVQEGTTSQLAYGYYGAFGDAMRAAGKALRAGGSQFHADYQTVEGVPKIRAAELAKGTDDARTSSPTNAALAFLRAALPTTWIGAADDFAKVFHYRAGARMLAYTDAAKGTTPEAAASQIHELMNNMPDGMHEQAVAYAVKNSFQEPLTGLAADMAAAIDKANIPIAGTGTALPFGRAIMPFIKIPVNLDRFAYRASPLPGISPTDAFRAELAAGGSRAALAKAGVALGSAWSVTMLALAAGDNLTGMGPSDPDVRRFWQKTHQPYSFRWPPTGKGGTWYSYQGAHPLGLMTAPVADTADILRFAHDRDAEDAALSLAFGVGHALLSPTFMLGASDFLEAINDPSQDGRRYFDNLAASIGAPQGVAAIDNAMDPWRRAHYNAIQAIEARTWGLSKSLPPVVDLWGDPIPRSAGWIPGLGDGGAMGRAFSPVAMQDADAQAQPIDKWIYDNRGAFPRGDVGRLGMSPPGQAYSFDGGNGVSAHVQLTPQQIYRLRVLAGNELKDPATKLGAKDALNALVQGNFPLAATQAQFNKGSPELRALMVQRFWGQYRAGANKALLAEDEKLRDIVTAQLGQRKEQLTTPASRSGTPAMPQLGARP